MPAPPRWLLAVPDAIRQLEALDRDLLTRRDVERLFGVSRARAAQLMRTFGAERVGAAADGPGALAASRPGDDQAALAAADLPPSTCCHTFRATGITAYLSNGGTLEHAQRIAAHASPKTTKLYDRTADTITVDEIERIVI